MKKSKVIIFSVFSVCLFFIILEGIFRISGFRYDTKIESMKFTFPIDEYNDNAEIPFLERHPVFFWRPKPHVFGHNSRGYLGKEFKPQKDQGIFRIVMLGDSCTHFGPTPYPKHLEILLKQDQGKTYEVINAGTIGYSSYQGRLLMDKEIKYFTPDVITVYFGWNDHWLARGLRDAQQSASPNIFFRLHNILNRLRFYQFCNLTIKKFFKSKETSNIKRVSLSEYRENLVRIKEIADEIGAKVVFVTAAHAYDLGVPSYLYTSGEVAKDEDIVKMHEAYNNVVRTLSREYNVFLVDFAKDLADISPQDKISYFEPDHGHLSDKAKQILAQEIFEVIVESPEVF